MLSTGEVSCPLSDDHHVHIAEEDEQEDNLRYEFKEEVKLVFEVMSV